MLTRRAAAAIEPVSQTAKKYRNCFNVKCLFTLIDHFPDASQQALSAI
jgi:hypothetical protein